MNGKTHETVLALRSVAGGVGWVVATSPISLLDWGVIRTKRRGAWLERVDRIIRTFGPTVLVTGFPGGRTRRQTRRFTRLSESMRHIARSRGIKLELYARGRIRRSFEPLGATTRYDIAKLLSQSINELALRLPPQRRPWMTEDGRMALFDAAAMAVTYFRERDGDELPTIAA